MPRTHAARKAAQRRAPREAVDVRSQIWGTRLAPCPALIVNISPYGCMVRTDERIRIGQGLTVDVPGVGGRPGQVIWAMDARIGIEFEDMIPLDDYLATMSRIAENSHQISALG
jgi:hypothetical protein